jgi:phage terminase Nu1 subunit (DNA packaging protein)
MTLINTKELTRLLGVKEKKIRQLRKEGMPHLVVGEHTLRYDFEGIKEWLRTRHVK